MDSMMTFGALMTAVAPLPSTLDMVRVGYESTLATMATVLGST